MALAEIVGGATLAQLQAAAPAEAALPEQTPVQLNLRVRAGAATIAPALDWALKQAGLQPWNGASTIATGSSLSQTVTVRWTKASVGLPIIAAILAGGVAAVLIATDIPGWVVAILGAAAVALIVVVAWSFFRRVASTVGSVAATAAPYALPALGLAVAVYALLEISGETPYAISIRKHLEARSALPPLSPGPYADRAASPLSSGHWLSERVRLTRRAVADRYVVRGVTEAQEGLGATPETAAAFRNLLAFQEARGLRTRIREIPSDGPGEVTNGAYSPDLESIVLAPAALAEDPAADETLFHEVAHSIAHSPDCAVDHSTASQSSDFETYANSPEEVEAVAASLLAMQRLSLPLEDVDGETVPPSEWHVNEEQMRSDLPLTTYRRIRNTARILEQAARTGAAAAPLAETCPQDMHT